jgi:hypothetical protein
VAGESGCVIERTDRLRSVWHQLPALNEDPLAPSEPETAGNTELGAPRPGNGRSRSLHRRSTASAAR